MSLGESPQNLFIRKVKLENFRIYSEKSFEFNGEIVIFTGKNGVGKSSILEAISMLSNLKSFRAGTDRDLICHGKSHYYIEMEYSGRQGSFVPGLGFGKKGPDEKAYERRMRLNRESISKISDFIGKIQTIIFAPDDINIIEAGPLERRRFVDMLLSIINNRYLVLLQNYRRVLKMRSSFFSRAGKNIDDKFLASFDQEMIRFGSEIQKYRAQFVDGFKEIFFKYIREISANKDLWSIEYQPSIPEGKNPETYKNSLNKARGEDIRTRQTTKGIHRDRFLFTRQTNPGIDISRIGSQGQKRTAVLALKMSQYEYTRNETTQNPVLLIDDVLNELDIERRKKFIDFLQNTGQAFITATDISALNEFIESKKNTSKIQIFNLDEQTTG